VLIVPTDVSRASAPSHDLDFAVHRAAPVTRPSDAELDRIADALNAGGKVAIYGGSGCQHAHRPSGRPGRAAEGTRGSHFACQGLPRAGHGRCVTTPPLGAVRRRRDRNWPGFE
jgi:hypothetical protein